MKYKTEKSDFEVLDTGQYVGVIIDERPPEDNDKYAYQRFGVEVGLPEKDKGKRISIDYPAKVTAKTGLGQFFKGTLGVDLKEGLEVDSQQVVGKKVKFDAIRKSKEKDGQTTYFNEWANIEAVQ